MKKFVLLQLFNICIFASFAQGNFSNPNIGIGVVVEDLERSIDFYTNIIGMTKTGEFSVDQETCKELGLTDKYQLDVTILKLENSEQASEWKLMSLGTKSQHPKQNHMSDDTGMQYITLHVKHITPVLERIKKHKVKILSGSPSTLGDDRKFLLVQDPDGIFIEIIGPE